MNTPNPLIPQGSLEAQQLQKRSATKIVVSAILAVHGVVLGGLLFLGCRREEPKEADLGDTNTYASYEPMTNATGGSPFGDLTTPLNEDLVIPQANTNLFDGLPPMPADSASSNLFGSTTYAPAPGITGTVDTSLYQPPTSDLIQPEPEPVLTKYTVLPNDNFWVIARKHGVTAKAITEANPGVDSRRLKVGQVLNLPANVKPSTPAVPNDSPSTAASAEVRYKVKSGDSLSKIARQYGVTIKALQQANGIRGSLIRVGQELVIPVASESGGGQ
ncbi:MAG TPA: hypothetical protein DCY13_23285 [Verrucomicrobiales bacterium]|nr:hypothetical protein [Verrucomicrobiales bacterium]